MLSWDWERGLAHIPAVELQLQGGDDSIPPPVLGLGHRLLELHTYVCTCIITTCIRLIACSE